MGRCKQEGINKGKTTPSRHLEHVLSTGVQLLVVIAIVIIAIKIWNRKFVV